MFLRPRRRISLKPLTLRPFFMTSAASASFSSRSSAGLVAVSAPRAFGAAAWSASSPLSPVSALACCVGFFLRFGFARRRCFLGLRGISPDSSAAAAGSAACSSGSPADVGAAGSGIAASAASFAGAAAAATASRTGLVAANPLEERLRHRTGPRSHLGSAGARGDRCRRAPASARRARQTRCGGGAGA